MFNGLRLIHSDYLVPVTHKPIKDGCVVINKNHIIDFGEFEELRSKYNGLKKFYYKGALMPGLVNSHTHLELSTFKNSIHASGEGLPDWLSKFNKIAPGKNIKKTLHSIDSDVKEMKKNGTVAVGDISNTGCTLGILEKQKMLGTVFREYYDILGAIECKIRDTKTGKKPVSTSLSPHALYSTSRKSFNDVVRMNRNAGRKTSMHFYEDNSEVKFIREKSGPLGEFLISLWPDAEKYYDNVLCIDEFMKTVSDDFILVHCVSINKKIIGYLRKKKPSIVICPRSNIFISGKLPPIYDIVENKINVAIGTDSLASCHDLDVRNEIVLIRNKFKRLEHNFILRMATLNGATALGLEDKIGSIDKGKQPCIINVEFDEDVNNSEKFIVNNIEKLTVRRIF